MQKGVKFMPYNFDDIKWKLVLEKIKLLLKQKYSRI